MCSTVFSGYRSNETIPIPIQKNIDHFPRCNIRKCYRISILGCNLQEGRRSCLEIDLGEFPLEQVEDWNCRRDHRSVSLRSGDLQVEASFQCVEMALRMKVRLDSHLEVLVGTAGIVVVGMSFGVEDLRMVVVEGLGTHHKVAVGVVEG